MKGKQQISNWQVTFCGFRVTDRDTNNSKDEKVILLLPQIVVDIFLWTIIKIGLLMHIESVIIKKIYAISLEKNTFPRNVIFAITIHIDYERLYIICYTDLFVTRMNKSWNIYVG